MVVRIDPMFGQLRSSDHDSIWFGTICVAREPVYDGKEIKTEPAKLPFSMDQESWGPRLRAKTARAHSEA